MASTDEDEHRKKLEMLLEAARRANWDALHGPRHLRSGRYHPAPVELDADRGDRRPFDDVLTVGGMLSRACLEEGLLVRGALGKVVAAGAPPLVLTTQQADELVNRLGRALDRFAGQLQQSGRWQSQA